MTNTIYNIIHSIFTRLYYSRANQMVMQLILQNFMFLQYQFIIVNNYNIKMKDQTFLNNLVDFKDLKLSSKNQMFDHQLRSRDSFQSKASYSAAQLDLDVHNNDKLLKNFKQLRQQLKQTTKTCQKLRIKIDQKQTQVDRLKLSERDYVTTNHHLRSQIQHLKHSNEDLKAKLDLLKNMAKNANNAEQQIQFLKITVNDYKNKIFSLESQRNKIMQISILQKVELEQKIKKFEAKKYSDIEYVQEMEIQVSKLRQKCIKLENQMKKVQIKYDQQMYTRQWGQVNFQKQHLQEQLKQVDSQNQQLLAKHKKEKEKRSILQKRVLELEQTTGLWIVKAQTYEQENKALQKKYKQAHKKMEQLKEQSNKKISQVLTLEQKFGKATSIADELISRVKREMYGDIVALAKSCQFKLGKLKEDKQTFFKNADNQVRKSIEGKARSKSKQKLRFLQQKQRQTQFETQAKPTLINLRDKFEQCMPSRTVTQTNQQPSQKSKRSQKINSETNRSLNPLVHIENIEARIKKQRDDMQKKIRQKMLYRKLQVANSPEKHQLREDYFRLFQH